MSLGEVFRNMNWGYIGDLLISIIPAVLCITVHETCHGLAALALGDDTAASQGRISLNPLHHIDIMGLVMLVVFRVGWAKPVSVDARRFKNPKAGMALTALAGPCSNFLLSLLALFIYGLLFRALFASSLGETVLKLLIYLAYMSIGLGVFNLVPIPPLDGSKVLFALLPERAYAVLMRYERYGMIIIVVIMLSGVLGDPISAVVGFIYEKFAVAAELGLSIVA